MSKMSIDSAFASASRNTWTEGACVYYNFSGEYLEQIWAGDANQARVIRRGLIADRVADLLNLEQTTRRMIVRRAERESIKQAKLFLKSTQI